MNVADTFPEYRSYLFSVAYHILGEIQEAEDIVQDSFEQALSLPPDQVRNPKSYLTRVVANKAIDRLKERQKMREHYPGTWLPEPYVTPNMEEDSSLDMLSYGMMHLLEQLNPLERAVFILREAFGYSYEALADLCEVSQDNCRQILSRARKKIQVGEEKAVSDSSAHQHLLNAFLQAREKGNPQVLARLLKEDMVLYSDGGGKKAAARVPLYGREVVVKFLMGISGKPQTQHLVYQPVQINGQPGVLISIEGQADSLLTLSTDGRQISQLFFIRNPDKIFLPKSVTKPE